MRINISKEWCARMAQLEGDAEIGAGLFAIDPVFDGEACANNTSEEPSLAFGRLIRLMRRDRGLSLEKLAEDADVDVSELISIEDDVHFRPDVRTVYQLATTFKFDSSKLLEVAGLTAARDNAIVEEAVRFAARSEPIAALSPEERAALEAFVAILSERR